MYAFVIVIVAAVIAFGSVLITKQDQNPIEKAAEEVIEEELHLPDGSVNLTPKEMRVNK